MEVNIRKWRLFGRLNLLDVALLLIILTVMVRYGYAYALTHWLGERRPIAVTFVVKGVLPVAAQQLQPGFAIHDAKTENALGFVVAVETKPAAMNGLAADYQSTELQDLYITVAGPGQITAQEIRLGRETVRVGQPLNLQTRSWAGTGYPVAIDLTPPQR